MRNQGLLNKYFYKDFDNFLANVEIDNKIQKSQTPLNYFNNNLDFFRDKTANALINLCYLIDKDIENENRVVLISLLRGGITTSIIIKKLLMFKKKKYYPLVGLPLHRQYGNKGKIIISINSIKKLLNLYPNANNFYLIDGWTGTGQSIKIAKETLLEHVKAQGKKIRTAVGIDLTNTADFKGTNTDTLFLHSFCYHNLIGVKIIPFTTNQTLPKIIISRPSNILIKETEVIFNIAAKRINSSRIHDDSNLSHEDYSSVFLRQARLMKLGIGINEAIHRSLRDKDVVIIPKHMWNSTIKDTLNIANISKLIIDKNSAFKDIISVPREFANNNKLIKLLFA